MSRAPLRVAVLGAGTVGREVVRGLLDHPERLAPPDGPVPQLVGVAVRDVDRAAARGLPAGLLTDAPAHLVASPDTDVVVELIGGAEPARTLIAAALEAGKAVVTANKHVIAHHGPELEATARRSGGTLRFEAAVAGGIPVVAPLAGDLVANRLQRVRGIVNGTTNHILSSMATDGRTYEAVLREAQELGYAEADPSGDVAGHDAVNKIVILARLAFAGWIDPAVVANRPPAVDGDGGPGITGVTADDIAAAAAFGLTLKLVAEASRPRPEGPVAISVVPTAVDAASPLGRTAGVRNRIELRGEPVGEVGFDGPGAGGAATSSAVLGDIAAVARGAGSTWGALPPARRLTAEAVADGRDATRSWLVLLRGRSQRDGGLDEIADATAKHAAGVVVRTVPLALETLRARLAGGGGRQPPTATTLYPIDG